MKIPGHVLYLIKVHPFFRLLISSRTSVGHLERGANNRGRVRSGKDHNPGFGRPCLAQPLLDGP